RLARLCIPHLGGVVPARGDDVAAVRTELGVLHVLLMLQGRRERLPGGRIPHPRGIVLRACGDNAATIPAERSVQHPTAMLESLRRGAARGDLPDLRCVVIARRDEAPPIRTEFGGPDMPCV